MYGRLAPAGLGVHVFWSGGSVCSGLGQRAVWHGVRFRYSGFFRYAGRFRRTGQQLSPGGAVICLDHADASRAR
jgi:hypothetical protein